MPGFAMRGRAFLIASHILCMTTARNGSVYCIARMGMSTLPLAVTYLLMTSRSLLLKSKVNLSAVQGGGGYPPSPGFA